MGILFEAFCFTTVNPRWQVRPSEEPVFLGYQFLVLGGLVDVHPGKNLTWLENPNPFKMYLLFKIDESGEFSSHVSGDSGKQVKPL